MHPPVRPSADPTPAPGPAHGAPPVPQHRPAPGARPGHVPASSTDDTVDLHLTGDLAALLTERDAGHRDRATQPHPASPAPARRPAQAPGGSTGTPGTAARGSGPSPAGPPPPAPDLLDDVAGWPAARTPVGIFQLVPVRLVRDLPLITAWMNDPAVAAFWHLAGPRETTAAHLRAQLDGDGRSVPCLGVLDGVPMSYWEIYRADLDPLARHCRLLPHDTGLHLLVGGGPDRGRGVGTALLRSVADLVLDRRPDCTRVLAEPDVRNTPSVAAFLGAGFRLGAEVRLPDKHAALMIRDRELRDLL